MRYVNEGKNQEILFTIRVHYIYTRINYNFLNIYTDAQKPASSPVCLTPVVKV